MKTLLILCVGLLWTAPALASAGVQCSADDENVSIGIEAGASRGMGAAIFALRGEVEIRQSIVAEDLARTVFDREHLAQYWWSGNELRFLLYRERDADKEHGYVQLTVETSMLPGDEGEGQYDGQYTLEVYDIASPDGGAGKTVERQGSITCAGE